MPVLYDLVTQCLGSLIFSFVSVTSLNDVPTIRGIKFWIAHNRTHPPLGMSKLLHLHLFLPKTDCDQNLGDARTRFVDVSNVLEGSVNTTATAETIHDCLINLLNSLDLKIQTAKAFTSDGASVMTGHQSGVAA